MTADTGGGIVEMAAGYVEHSGTVTVPSGVVVTGSSQSHTSINYTSNAVAFRFYVSGDKCWYSSLRDFSILDTGTGTVGIGVYNGQHCKVENVRIDGFTTGMLFDGDDGGGTEGCYNNSILFCDINNATTGIDMGTDAFINQNQIIGGRIRNCSNYWIKIGDDGNAYYNSSNLITGVNFNEITADGGIGVYIKGRRNFVFGNRFENDSNHAGTQTYIKLFPVSVAETPSVGNQIGPNCLAMSNIDVGVDDSSGDDNVILEPDYGYHLLRQSGTPSSSSLTLEVGGQGLKNFGVYTTSTDCTLTAAGSDVMDLVPTASALHVALKGGVRFAITGKGSVTSNQTFTPADTIVIMNPSDNDYNLDPSGTFGSGHVIIVRNSNGVANSIVFDSGGLAQSIAAGKSRMFYYSGTGWLLFDFT